MSQIRRPPDKRPMSPIPDERVTAISRRIRAGLVDDHGRHPEVEEVRQVVEETAAELADAPIQDFVPLLTEHQARDALHGAGLRLGPPRPSTDEDGDGGDDDDPDDR
jgi:hypothetical protein